MGNWLAFARQKLQELSTLAKALDEGRGAVAQDLNTNQKAIGSRRDSSRVHNPVVAKAVSAITPAHGERKSPFNTRAKLQQDRFQLPAYPTTTIGSFPQTPEIRQVRKEYRLGNLNKQDYTARIHEEIGYCVEQQEALGLQMYWYTAKPNVTTWWSISASSWEVMYSAALAGCTDGSRCVKPPILFGDITRPNAMTVDWIKYAQVADGQATERHVDRPCDDS